MKRLRQRDQAMSKLTQVLNDKTEIKFRKLDSTASNLNAAPFPFHMLHILQILLMLFISNSSRTNKNTTVVI